MTPYKDPEERTRMLERQIEELLAEISPANRADVELFVRQRQARWKPTSVLNNLYAVARADELLKGKSFRDASPADWTYVLGAYRTTPTRFGRRPWATSVDGFATHQRTLLKWLLDVDDGERLPRTLRRALETDPGQPRFKGNVVPDEDMDAMVESASERGRYGTSLRPLLDVSVLRHYRRAGWRNQEGLSMNQGNVVPTKQAPKHTYDLT